MMEFLNGTSHEHQATVIALGLVALEWEPDLEQSRPTERVGRWICRCCKAATASVALFVLDANHNGGCPVQAAQDGMLAERAAHAAQFGAHGTGSTWSKMIAEVTRAAVQRHASGSSPECGEPVTIERIVSTVEPPPTCPICGLYAVNPAVHKRIAHPDVSPMNDSDVVD